MSVPLDICHIIAEYVVPGELLDWISQENLDWYFLSANPAAIHLLEVNPVCYANDSLPRFLQFAMQTSRF